MLRLLINLMHNSNKNNFNLEKEEKKYHIYCVVVIIKLMRDPLQFGQKNETF